MAYEGEPLIRPPQQRGTECSWLFASLTLANIVLGIGLLNFPRAYQEAGGVAVALPVQAVCLGFVLVSSVFICHCADLCGGDTYQDLVKHYGGRVALVTCNVFIVAHNFGTCITFMAVLGDQMDKVMVFVYGSGFCNCWYMQRGFTASMTSIFCILPFCFHRKMDQFKYGSLIGIVTTVYVLGLVIAKFFLKRKELQPEIKLLRDDYTRFDFLYALPTICFSFEGHIELVPLYSGLKKRNIREMGKVVAVGYTVCVVVYTLVGVFGVLTFPEYVTSDLIAAYYPIDISVIVGVAIVAVKAVTTYPVVLFCVRLVTDECFESTATRWKWSERNRLLFQSLVLFFISLMVALLVPNIGSIIVLLGGSAALFIFVFPGLCLMKAHLHGTSWLHRGYTYAGVLYMVLGAFIAGFALAASVMRYNSSNFLQEDVQCM